MDINSTPLSMKIIPQCEECDALIERADEQEYLQTHGGAIERVCLPCYERFHVD